MLDLLLQPLSLGFMQRALAASVLVGALTALVGVDVVLRGLAFIGDAISHAAFPGVVIAFVLKLPIYPGAIVAAVLTALGIGWVSRRAAVRLDTAIGVIFAGTFAAGVLILSTIKGYVGDLMGFCSATSGRHGWRPRCRRGPRAAGARRHPGHVQRVAVCHVRSARGRPPAIQWACSSTGCWSCSR
jgi:hypothetical protein